MNRKGQALVEFVLILPVFILLVFAFIDVGKIILCKNNLESLMNDAVLLIKNNDNIEDVKKYVNENSNYKIDVIINKDEYTKIILKTNIDLTTPGIDKILSENIKIERSIINE